MYCGIDSIRPDLPLCVHMWDRAFAFRANNFIASNSNTGNNTPTNSFHSDRLTIVFCYFSFAGTIVERVHATDLDTGINAKIR